MVCYKVVHATVVLVCYRNDNTQGCHTTFLLIQWHLPSQLIDSEIKATTSVWELLCQFSTTETENGGSTVETVAHVNKKVFF